MSYNDSKAHHESDVKSLFANFPHHDCPKHDDCHKHHNRPNHHNCLNNHNCPKGPCHNQHQSCPTWPWHNQHQCCPCPPWPPHCSCHKPMPEPTPEPGPDGGALTTAQLLYTQSQKPAENSPLTFNMFDGVSNTDSAAPLYFDGGTLIFQEAGRYIITYGVDVHFGNNILNDVRLGLYLGGTLIAASVSHGRTTLGVQTLNKTVVLNIPAAGRLQLVCITNDDPNDNEFRNATLVLDARELAEAEAEA